MIFGFFKNALAMAILCFYPPESCPPDDPTYVCKPVLLNLVLINFQALAAIRASIISSSVASGFDNLMFSSIDVLKRTGSYPTYPTNCLYDVRFRDFKSIPSTFTTPLVGS